jgi:hypothetical protein
MEVLEVSGYVSEEKVAIAERYLSPQAKEASGLKDTDISLEPEAIATLIRYYCRESGVRNLKKHIDKVCQLIKDPKPNLNSFAFNRSTEKLLTRSFLIWVNPLCQNRRKLRAGKRDPLKRKFPTSSPLQRGCQETSHHPPVNQAQSKRPQLSPGKP